MWLRGSPTTDVANSIISYNTGDYGIRNEGTLTVDYTDFYGNDSGAIAGNVPSGFGVLDTINYNSDSCDVYFNIFMDPMFVDTANGDYHLTAGSPCIDAGDPAFAYDPDSTITDMGAYWYDQGIPEINIPLSLLDFGTVTVGDSSSLPLTIHNIGNADLILYNVTNNLSVFTNDWNPADSLILPGDSLEVTVTFTPDDTVTFTDTLWIDNNDTLAYVELTGVGEPPSGIAEDIPPLGAPALKVCGSNLFSNSITFRISGVAKSKEPIKLQIFDVAGRRVKQISLLPFNLSVGAQATWDGKDEEGRAVRAGIYFISLNGSIKQKVVKIK